jgi:hypothetical protein
MQPDAFADAVVVMVKNALAPVVERLAAAEAKLAMLGDVRDRVVAMETKDATEPILREIRERFEKHYSQPNVTTTVDISDLRDRLTTTEALLKNIGDLRDRVVVMETKAAQPVERSEQVPVPEMPVVDLTPLAERIAAAESLLKNIGDLRDRVVVMETKSSTVVPVDLTDVREKLATVETELRTLPKAAATDVSPLLEKFEALGTEVNALRERVAVAEMRQLIQGPPGHDGRDGIPGRDGKDGLDGLGWDDLNVSQVDERTFTVKCLRGLQVKELGTLTFPVQIYRGVYVEGKTYDKGDGVTYGGSEWHCNETTTTKPGDGSKSWTLKVKRGRDGKDGKDVSPLPVIAIR